MDERVSASIWKRILRQSRISSMYSRITLSKFTASYFSLALLTSIVLVVLQSLTFADNTKAVGIISDLLLTGNVTQGITFVSDDGIVFCDDIPAPSAGCRLLGVPGSNTRRSFGSPSTNLAQFHRRAMDVRPYQSQDSGLTEGVVINGATRLDTVCLQSFLWLGDTLRDARREDVVTMMFHIWLFGLTCFTIMDESLPHMGAGLLGHVLGTAWAGYRVSSSKKLRKHYSNFIVDGSCKVDLLADWWDVRDSHTIPILVVNTIALVSSLYLSVKLYKLYASQSFSRIGADSSIRQVYKIVLLLSVSLQLAGFFTLASTGIWIDKVSKGTVRQVARHLTIYLASFGLTAFFLVPWLILGWISVRREKRVQFAIFCVFSLLLFAIATVTFASQLYQFIFMVWPFFATMTVTSYVLLVVTSAVAIVCRFHFGRGLSQFLQAQHALDDMDFTPSMYYHDESKSSSFTGKDFLLVLGKDDKTSHPLDIEAKSGSEPTLVELPRSGRRGRQIMSVYSDNTRATVKLSSTPRLARGASPIRSSLSSLSRSIMSGKTTRSSSIRASAKLMEERRKAMAGGQLRSISPVSSFHIDSSGPAAAKKIQPSPLATRGGAGLPEKPRAAALKEPIAGNYF